MFKTVIYQFINNVIVSIMIRYIRLIHAKMKVKLNKSLKDTWSKTKQNIYNYVPSVFFKKKNGRIFVKIMLA